MNQRDSAEVLEYISQENKYCENYFKPLSPLVDELMKEFEQRIDPNEEGAPFIFNKRIYQAKSEEGLNTKNICTRKIKSSFLIKMKEPKAIPITIWQIGSLHLTINF